MDNSKPEVGSDTPALPTQPLGTTEQETPAATAKRSSWPLRLTLLLSLLLALLACAIGAYLFWQLQQQQAANAQLATTLEQVKQAPEARLQALEQQLRSDRQQNQQQQGAIEQLSDAQQQMQTRIATLAQRNPNHWMAAEAEYLVRMAGRKLWLEKDPQTATGLLQAADERIAAMQEPSLMPLRRALANDMAAVSAIKNTDIAGTVFTLDGIITKLDKLPLNRVGSQQMEPEAENKMSDSIGDWQSNLSKTWSALKEDFFTIRKISSDITPLLSPQQEWYLFENIRNKLLQSQLALYQYDELNYRQSLAMARKWVQQYFDLDDPRTEEVLTAINALSSLQLDPINLTKFESSAQLKQLVTYGELMPGAEL
ncbi:uroporphyrinogen-III C-methyltransferase [Shewanella algae]|uniref:uroporphyrinogen-III C-methyltransferase n=1 Tax=Shewanella algae TaxID=38313 RepID=UPI0031F550CB